MDKKLDRDWLEQILSEEEPFLEDNGFSQRVMQALPRRKVSYRLRSVILFGAALSSLLISLWVLPGARFLSESLAEVFCFGCWSQPNWLVLLSSTVILVFSLVGALAWARSES